MREILRELNSKGAFHHLVKELQFDGGTCAAEERSQLYIFAGMLATQPSHVYRRKSIDTAPGRLRDGSGTEQIAQTEMSLSESIDTGRHRQYCVTAAALFLNRTQE